MVRAYRLGAKVDLAIVNTSIHPRGADRRRGPFRAGERVQVTDTKGRKYTTMLTEDGYFQSARGSFRHRDLIGKPEGTVLDTHDGYRVQCMRPLVADYVLSMPRGATPVYPKDAGQIIHMADVFPGAHVVEAGLGSGALTLALLGAVGPTGHVTSVERREEFARIAEGNVTSWFGEDLPPWEVVLGDLEDVLRDLPESSVDHVILDMLAPWDNIDAAAMALRPGGVIVGYVATTTQLSRFVEELRDSQYWTEPESWESFIRTWHLEGLSVRPDHRMVAHTGFLVTARRLAPGSEPLIEKRRPAKAAYSDVMPWEDPANEELTERRIAPKKLRRIVRDVEHRAKVEQTGMSTGEPRGESN